MRYAIKAVGLAIPFLALTGAFFSNEWGTADDPWFQQHQRVSEALVVSRIAAIQQHGFGYRGGLMLDPLSEPVLYQSFLSGHADVDAMPSYLSQIGAQGSIFGIVASALHLSPKAALTLFWLFNSVILAALITWFIWWTQRLYGTVPALVVFALCMTAQWLIVFARNLYWVEWTWFLPFFFFLWAGGKPGLWTKRGAWQAFAASLVLAIVKCANGYEYLSTIATAAAVPVVFYGIYPSVRRWTTVAVRVVSIGAGFVVGFLVTIATHLSVLSSQLGGFSAAWVAFRQTFGKRVGADAASLPSVFRESLEAGLPPLLWTYLDGKEVYFGLTALGLLLLCSLAAIVVTVKLRGGEIPRDKLPAYVALGPALAAGFIAPLSWHVLAKPHSYVHTHMNFVLWYLPFGLFAAIAIGVLLDESLKTFIGSRRVLPVISGALALLALIVVVKQERLYRETQSDCASKRKFCFEHSSFDVFSEGDLQIGSERFRIADNYIRTPFWRGHRVIVVHPLPR